LILLGVLQIGVPNKCGVRNTTYDGATNKISILSQTRTVMNIHILSFISSTVRELPSVATCSMSRLSRTDM